MVLVFPKDAASKVGRSGLTGPADIPDPPVHHEPGGLVPRLRRTRTAVRGTVAGLPRVLGLVWQASPWLTVGLGAATIVTGLVPAATAYTGRLLLNAVAEAIRIHAGRLPDHAVLTVTLPGLTLRSAVWTSTTVIVVLVAVQFLIFALSAVLFAVRNISQQLLQEKVSLIMQHRVIEQAGRLDLTFFENSRSYDLLRQAEREAATRPVTMISSAFSLIQFTITFASVIALLFGLGPLLALIALITPVPAFLSDAKYGMRSFILTLLASPLRRRMQYLSTLVTTDTFAKEVKLFGLGPFFARRFRLLGEVFYARQRRLVSARYLVGSAWSLIITGAGSLTYLYVALQVASSHLTLGDLILYTTAVTAVQTSVQGLFQSTADMYEHNLYLDNLYALLATSPTIRPPPRPRALPDPLRGHVVFEQVSFSYPGSDMPALDDVSFEIPAGRTIAVVGRNGAGKSTLIKLLCRLYDPTEGRILLDGVDIRELDPDELRANIAAMFQDYVTYQASAAENIGLGDVRRIEDRARIEQSARRAGADGLITRLPRGYDTALGKWFDKGVELSGGEWQKVALSRAFMRDAPILLLDEPTAALDPYAEHELLTRLRRLGQGRTTIYISHRFSTVRQAHRILLLEHGRLTEQGTHEELMRQDGAYARLYTLQASAYTDASTAEHAHHAP